MHACECTQTCAPTDVPRAGAVVLDLGASDEVPETGHPVGQQGEGGHEEGEDHGAVLGVAVQLLQETQQAQQAHRLQQVDPEVLRAETTETRRGYRSYGGHSGEAGRDFVMRLEK